MTQSGAGVQSFLSRAEKKWVDSQLPSKYPGPPEVAALFRAGRLAPVVDQVFPAAEARAAYERLEAANQFGKIVIRW